MKHSFVAIGMAAMLVGCTSSDSAIKLEKDGTISMTVAVTGEEVKPSGAYGDIKGALDGVCNAAFPPIGDGGRSGFGHLQTLNAFSDFSGVVGSITKLANILEKLAGRTRTTVTVEGVCLAAVSEDNGAASKTNP